MKTHVFLTYPSVATFAFLLLTNEAEALGLTNLHNFSLNPTNGDSAWAGLVVSGGTLFGTTYGGGASGIGTVFRVNRDGSGFTVLHSFDQADGGFPKAALILSGSTLYGTTYAGGTGNVGTVFAINTDGTGFTNLHSFPPAYLNPSGALTNVDGAGPAAKLALSGGTLFGTTAYGGSGATGTIFKINTNGTGFAVVHSFAFLFYDSSTGTTTNSDGGGTITSLVLSGNLLYGSATSGGNCGSGTLFKVNADGTGFTTLYRFSPPGLDGSVYTNREGMGPMDLVLSGSNLFGATGGGGEQGSGTVFRINTDGMFFTNLYSFSSKASGTNQDGASPYNLTLSGGTLYGVTIFGGSGGAGTIFSINTDGTDFTSLYEFSLPAGWSTNSDGGFPRSTLVLSSNAFYGTTQEGGTAGRGTVFAFAFPTILSGATWLGNGVFQFDFNTAPGVTCTIDYSTNLTHWVSILSFSSLGGRISFQDPNAGINIRRFYRVKTGL